MIEVNNLCKTFFEHQQIIKAVDNISFICRPGEIFGLLGPNGAGKTTALRILSTVLKPCSGEARVAGFDVVKNPQEVRQNIGFISGNTNIYDRLTPEETIFYFGRLYGMDKERLKQRCREIYTMFEMEKFAHTLNAKLSAGTRQKVSIARAIVHCPPVLIFDEPTANLDIMVARSVLNFIRECRDDKKCVILSTHIMSEAEKLCDKIGILHEGKILALGTLEDLRCRTGLYDMEDIFFSLVKQI